MRIWNEKIRTVILMELFIHEYFVEQMNRYSIFVLVRRLVSSRCRLTNSFDCKRRHKILVYIAIGAGETMAKRATVEQK